MFQNFLLIYLAFALCMLMLLIPLYLVSLREAEQRTLDTASETLHSGISTFEEALENAATVADSLYSRYRIASLGYLNDEITSADTYTITEGLYAYRTAHVGLSLAIDTGMRLRNGALISNGGNRFFRYAADSFDSNLEITYIYERDGIVLNTFDRWMNALGILGQPYTLTPMRMGRTDAAMRDVVIYAVSLPLNTPTKTNFFYAIYDTHSIFDLLVLPQYQGACSLTLTHANGGAFLEHTTDMSDNFMEISYVSPLYGLNATLRIDRAVFSTQLYSFRVTMFVILVLYIAIGVVLALVFSWHNAKPMVRVIHAAEQTMLETGVTLDSPAPPVNSYQYIHTLIDSMGREVATSRRKQELQRVQLQESMFDRLLRGDLHHESGLNQARSFFPDFPACSCLILLRLMHSHEMDIATFSNAQLRLSDVLKSHLPAGIRVHFFSNLTVLLCPCEEAHYQETCANIISTLTPPLSGLPDLNVRFAVSTPMHGIDELSHVFQQLRHLLHIVGDTGERIFFMQDSEPTAAQEHSYSSTRFYEMLLRGESDVALTLMDEDVRRLKHSGMANETEVQQLFFIYRHELMRVRDEFQLTAPAVDTLPTLPDYRPQLSVDEMFDELRFCCRALGESIKASRVSERESFERKLLSYIDEHLGDTTLCVRSVIDQFSISESTLRNILAKSAGMNFSEYVENHRMRQAQLLVERSVIPVSQIPHQCGYASANTFYKAFKRYFGVSPSILRAQANGEAVPASDESI